MLSGKNILPNDISQELDDFVLNAKGSCKDNLVSIFLYGGVAKEEFITGYSDINVLIILKRIDVESLDELSSSLKRPMFSILLNPFILSSDELEAAVDLFPVKFLDIKRNHLCLFGDDLFDSIRINEDLLKRNCRREFKNILFRLNHIYVRNHATAEVLGNKMKGMFSPFLIYVNIYCYLNNGHFYKSKEEIIEQGAICLGYDKEVLIQLFQYRNGKQSVINDEIKSMYGKFLSIVKVVSAKADNL